jgi:hypothetical protein
VRANNAVGITYADNGTWWSFTVSDPPPFNKTSPSNGAINQFTNPTLIWEADNHATTYEYCIDTTNNNACNGSWISTLNNLVPLSGLTPGTTYYWQVRGNYATGITYANNGAWWSFTVASAPFAQRVRQVQPIQPGNHTAHRHYTELVRE